MCLMNMDMAQDRELLPGAETQAQTCPQQRKAGHRGVNRTLKLEETFWPELYLA